MGAVVSAVVEFPTPAPQPRITPESLATKLIEKAATGDPGSVRLLQTLQQRNPGLFRRFAEGPAEVVTFEPKRTL